MGIPLHNTPELYCDNLFAVYLTANPVFHARTKHFDIDHHYVRERVALGTLLVKHIPGTQQIADIFTKSLSYNSFSSLRFKLGVDVPPTQSLRGSIKSKTWDEVEKPPKDTEGSQNGNVLTDSKQMKRMGQEQTKPSPEVKPHSDEKLQRPPADSNRKDKDEAKAEQRVRTVSFRTEESITTSNRFNLLGLASPDE